MLEAWPIPQYYQEKEFTVWERICDPIQFSPSSEKMEPNDLKGK